ncbi:MAG: phosphoribosyl-AMP cyclohydrolase [Phycisphaeraceae bacterium]
MADADREKSTTLNPRLNDQGLIPAILQDHDTGDVLMMAWMNEDALRQTLETGKATFYSRSRNKTWVKGESSGHTQQVVEARIDCDQDTILLRCKPNGPACHVGYQTCFYRSVSPKGLTFVEKPVFDPDNVYKK